MIHPRATQGSRRVPTTSCGSPMGTRRGQVPLPHVPGGSRAINQPGSGFLGLLRSKFLPGTSPSANSWGSGCSCAREGRGLHGGGTGSGGQVARDTPVPGHPAVSITSVGVFWGTQLLLGGCGDSPFLYGIPVGPHTVGLGQSPRAKVPPAPMPPGMGPGSGIFWGCSPMAGYFG